MAVKTMAAMKGYWLERLSLANEKQWVPFGSTVPGDLGSERNARWYVSWLINYKIGDFTTTKPGPTLQQSAKIDKQHAKLT